MHSFYGLVLLLRDCSACGVACWHAYVSVYVCVWVWGTRVLAKKGKKPPPARGDLQSQQVIRREGGREEGEGEREREGKKTQTAGGNFSLFNSPFIHN